jgi:porin
LLLGAFQASAADEFDADGHLFGDLGGLRPKWEASGVTVNLTETSEVFGNVAGGLRRGAVYEGLAMASVKLDTGKLGLWDGGTFFVNAYQIHGRGPSRNLAGNLQTLSSIEATRATRLNDLYFEQSLFDDRLSIRIGQFAADEEFILTQYGANFLNSSFGFPILPATDLPSGGPAYPLPTPGVRVKFKASESLTLLAAVFNGDPAGPGTTDPQLRNADGTAFRTRDGTYSLIEAQYTLDPSEGDPAPLATTYRAGAWFHSQAFASQRFDTAGRPLASPASDGNQARKRGNYSLYAAIDQRVWSDPRAKAADDKDNGLNRGVGVFARVMGSPDDRNQIDLAVSAGAIWVGPFDSRPADVLGFGVNYARIGNAARGFDGDQVRFGSAGTPIRDSETVFELTYAAKFGWLAVQPSFQYVIHPGGTIANPNRPRQVIKDAAVLGLRVGVTF